MIILTREQYIKYNRSKHVPKVAVFLVLVMVMTVAFFNMPKHTKDVEAAAATSGVAINNDIPDEIGDKGSATNPFVILEIVPYEGYAEIGYLIDGCEPVDINNETLRTDSNAGMTLIASANASTVNWTEQYRFLDEDNIPKSFQKSDQQIMLYGYYEKVADNTGSFIEKKNETTGLTDYIKVETNKGNIRWHTVYGMTSDKTEANHSLNLAGDKFYTSRTDTGYMHGNRYIYSNNNYFLKNVLGLSDDKIPNFHVVVKTIEPDELNNHLEWIDRSDLISISPKSHISNLPTIWEKYNKVGKKADPYHATNFGGNDLSWKAVLKIFKKVNIEKDHASIIFDWNVYTEAPSVSSKYVTPCQIDYNGTMTTNNNGSEKGNSNNIYKLAIMMRTMDPVVFYNLFLNDYNGTKTPLVSNGLFTAQKNYNEQFYWSQSTFMPTLKDGSKAWNKYWDTTEMWNAYKLNSNMGDNVSVAGRVYTYNGTCALSQDLLTTNINQTKYTQELFDFIKGTGKTPTPAVAIDYILGPQNSNTDSVKKELKILDIEPSNEFTLTSFRIKMMVPYFTGDVTIVPMTSAEFIGKIEDLNSQYDMIYLGMNEGGLNTQDQYFPTINQTINAPYYNSALYRDSRYTLSPTNSNLSGSGLNQYSYTKLNDDLNGKIYLHMGPRVLANLGNQRNANLASTLNTNWIPGAATDIIRLPGNDITALKVKDLNNYLAAGYPILTDTNLYQTDSALTSLLVDKSSNIFNFIDTAKGGSYKDYLIDMNSSDADNKVKNTIMTEKLQLTLLREPVHYIGKDSNVGVIDDAYYINNNGNLSYRNLNYEYQIKGDSSKYYNVYLYIDANADGKFSSNEINITQKEVTANEPHTLTKRLASNYFGAIPWRLVAEEAGNPNIRAEQADYAAVKRNNDQKQEIRILQIINPNTVSLNLQKNIQQHQLFDVYTKSLNDYRLTVTTINVADFENLYKYGKKFVCTSEATEKATDQLVKNYDMLIFGFGDSYGDISNDNGALDNVKYFIDSYKSVLFTHDTTSPYNMSYSTNPTGYHFNLSFRGIFGMDRFGARKDNDLDSYNDPNRYEYVDKATDIYGNLCKETHGYTYFTAAKKANINQNLALKGILSGTDDSRGGAFTTNTASKLNDGQITQYPYLIDKDITIADTHSQWNQLNLNDPGIVVWYCLGEQKDADYATYASRGKAIYEVSPQDASNNYYIYNKGNITYSGVGHSSSNNDLSPMETKLFVNTIIASYKSAITAPEVEILNANGNNGNYVMYLSNDADDNGSTSYNPGDKLEIQFRPVDFNVSAQGMGMTASLNGKSMDIYEKGKLVPDKFVDKTGTKTDMAKVSNETVYTVLYDKSSFSDPNKRTITFTVENEKGLQGTCTVKLMNLTFFNLE